jgi:maleylacetate reductase
VIVRWGLRELAAVLGELGLVAPFRIASDRWNGLELPVEPVGSWSEVPSDRLEDAAAAATASDVLLAIGGGSAIDLAKAVSAQTGVPVVSLPTTYSGAEWTTMFGVRAPDKTLRGGGGGAPVEGIVYEPVLTLGLSRETSGGTAMNALAHCAEALYASGHNAEADAHALRGARTIAEWLPRVLADLDDLDSRTQLLHGAGDAGAALAGAGLALAHALAQAVGGFYGLPHGTLNGICLPPALRFNAALAPDAVARFAEAIGADDPAARVEELTALSGPTRLGEIGVREEDIRQLAELAGGRPGNQANPRPATVDEIEALLRSVY